MPTGTHIVQSTFGFVTTRFHFSLWALIEAPGMVPNQLQLRWFVAMACILQSAMLETLLLNRAYSRGVFLFGSVVVRIRPTPSSSA